MRTDGTTAWMAMAIPLLACCLLACGSNDPALPADDAGSEDPPPVDWHPAHCANRECFYVMQGVPGASDAVCNGRHPTDLGTTDANGERNCPYASFQSRVRSVLAPPDDLPNKSRTVFVGAGRYPIWGTKLAVRGDGAGPDEAVILTNYRGADVTLHSDECPAICTFDTPAGPITVTPCCSVRCDCDDAACIAAGGVDTGDGCAAPFNKLADTITVFGQWVRIEGMTIQGAYDDQLEVGARTTAMGTKLVPNDGIYLANNTIHGTDGNENIKGLGMGPGPVHGGPAWGPTHIIGNEFLDMASQAVDATGVHNWLVEDNYLHDAKSGNDPFGGQFDGGGIGFKNGGSQARVRNNWSLRGGGFGGGGGSGSCIFQTEPPHDYGCFQDYEMTDILVENNTALDIANTGLQAYQCDDCRFLGNHISGSRARFLVRVGDECPGLLCPSTNPKLKPSRNLRLERNLLVGGIIHPEGPQFFEYYRHALPQGPAAFGMVSRDNVFCAPDGIAEPPDPSSQLPMFTYEPASGDVNGPFALTTYRTQINDTGSSVYNDPAAAVAPCIPALPSCNLTVSSDRTEVSWSGPAACPDCTCSLSLDEGEQSVACTGAMPLPIGAISPGRHYVGLRVNNFGGGTSCGASYGISSKVVGAGCSVGVAGPKARWDGDGVSCRLVGDGDVDLGAVKCEGELDLPANLLTRARHHLRLRVLDSEFGQTTCGVVYNP